MRTSIVTFEAKTRARLQRIAWHARHHARDETEAIQVDQLCEAVAGGHVSTSAAYQALSSLRCQQQAEAA
jgi:hypothetical protein